MAMLYAHGERLLTLAQVAAGATEGFPLASRPTRQVLPTAPAATIPAAVPLTQQLAPAIANPNKLVAATPPSPPATPVTAVSGGQVPFQDVGLYKPLLIMIHQVWTGKYPPTPWLFQPAQSMLLTSAMKGILQTSGSPRALNFLTNQLPTSHRRLNTVEAPQPGSPLICYIPAVTQNLYSLTIEMGFNTFNQDLFNGISSILSQAGTFPLFMPYSPYILAAGTLAKLAGNLGQILFNAGIVLSSSQPLTFGLGGTETVKAGYYLVVPDSPDGAALASQYHVSSVGEVVDTGGQPYSGDVPYVVISIDGAQQDDSYKSFTPLAATADQLSTFFNIGDNSTAVVNDVVQGAQLANDLVYREKADQIQQQINALPASSPQLAGLQQQLAAYVANIQNSAMKPPSKSS